MIRKIFTVLIAAGMVFMTGCDNGHYTEYGGEITDVSGEELASMSASQVSAEELEREEAEESKRLAEEATATSLQIADRMGNMVDVPEDVSRIVSCSPAATEILSGLGLTDKIVAADMMSADVWGIDPDICTLDMMHINTQYIADLAPDLVVIGEISVTDESNPIAELRDKGVYTAYIPTANSIESIKMDIEFLAGLTGTFDTANELISLINTNLLYIEEIVADLPPVNVYFEVSDLPEIYAVGTNNFLADMIERAGGKTVLTDYSGFVQLSYEDIPAIISGADVIITNVSYEGYDYNEIYEREGFEALPAVANSQVYSVNTDYTSRASQNITAGVTEIAKILHPEAFPDEITEEIAA
ncbi:MAG: ABC transporter substrate-binding protein [Ruminococcus sp.]|jgi:iron complex transport system substrate-binding protein|nr:ABC transporter substrate-binding protein [Ruminococcus sp.]